MVRRAPRPANNKRLAHSKRRDHRSERALLDALHAERGVDAVIALLTELAQPVYRIVSDDGNASLECGGRTASSARSTLACPVDQEVVFHCPTGSIRTDTWEDRGIPFTLRRGISFADTEELALVAEAGTDRSFHCYSAEDLRINEVLYNAPGDDDDDYIEIFDPGDGTRPLRVTVRYRGRALTSNVRPSPGSHYRIAEFGGELPGTGIMEIELSATDLDPITLSLDGSAITGLSWDPVANEYRENSPDGAGLPWHRHAPGERGFVASTRAAPNALPFY